MSSSSGACVFCQIVRGEAPAIIVERWPDAVAFVPLRPVVKEHRGHVLVVPRTHAEDFMTDPAVTEATSRRAAELGAELLAAARAADPDAPVGLNMISSAGDPATQTVYHLHIHLLIRRPGDKITLPWTGQED